MTAEFGKPSICVVAHLAYGAMTGGNGGHIGGVERQTSLMARWFAARGYPVSMITWDEGQEDGTVIDGVRIFKACRRHAGLPGLRFFWPKWTSLNAAMKRADADVYYQNNAECVTGQVSLWCQRHGRKFIYSVASDTECHWTLPRMHSFSDRVLYRHGLLHAAAVIVQTRSQRDTLRRCYGRDPQVLAMPCVGPSEEEYASCRAGHVSGPRILWIGKIYELKRPDWFLDVAEACPELQFDLVGPPVNTEYSRSVCERAKTVPNVVFHGPVTRARVPDSYRKAGIMCCTSVVEGFPNTFLEAWSYGLPIVSTFDPDNLIKERGLGRVGASIEELVAGIRELSDEPDQWRKASLAARGYYVENHVLDVAMGRFERVVNECYKDCGE